LILQTCSVSHIFLPQELIMRTIFILLAVSLFLAGCGGNKSITASPVGLVNLPGYFTKNTVDLPNEVNYKAITSQAQFDEIFGAAQTAGTEIKKPEFSGQVVVAVILKATNKPTEVKIKKAEIGGADLNVYYSIETKNETQSFSTTPTAVAAVPRSQSVKRVNFYAEGGGGVKNGMVEIVVK
jgi:hypothetical protein